MLLDPGAVAAHIIAVLLVTSTSSTSYLSELAVTDTSLPLSPASISDSTRRVTLLIFS